MKHYTVIVKAHAADNLVTFQEDGTLVVSIRTQAREGKANGELIKVLATYFSLSPNKVMILKGERNKIKYIGILDD